MGDTTILPEATEKDLRLYRTPAALTDAILDRLDLEVCGGWSRAVALEPCAGDGAISDRLRARGIGQLALNEPVEELAEHLRITQRPCTVATEDARILSKRMCGGFDLIITNPPFNLAVDVFRGCWPMLRPGGQFAMLLRQAFIEGQGRAEFHRVYPADIYVSSRRWSFVPSGKIDRWGVAWFVWRKAAVTGGRWEVLDV
jgi:hypothetical protein